VTRDRRPAWNLLTGTLTNYVLLAVTIVIGIFLMPFTVRHLGQSDYGIWMLVASMTAYFQLLDLGYGSGLVRQITEADARGDEHEINDVLSTFVVVYSILGVVALSVTAILALLVLPRFPNLSAAQVVSAQGVLAILGVRSAIGFPMSVFGAVTTARQRFALTGSIAIVVAVVQAGVTYAMLTAGYGLVPLVAATTFLSIASYAAYAAAARRTFPAMRLSLSHFNWRHVRAITSFSAYLFLISIAIQVGTHVDNVIVGAYIGTSAVAVYTVALRLADYQRQLCGQFSGFLFPLVVRFHASKDVHALRSTLLDGTRIALGLVAAVALCLVMFGRELINLWMGPGFDQAVIPLYVLALAGIVMVAQGPTGTILLGTGHHRLVAWASIAEIVVNVGLSVALIQGFGLFGVALGTAIPYALLNIFVLIPIACRSIGVPLRDFIRVAAVPTLVALLPAIVVGATLRATAVPSSLPAVVVQAAIMGIVYVLAFWSMGLTSADRTRYAASIRAITGAMPAVARVATP
jgi:O-antigen/teichoic acid export membrane protein